MSLSVNTSTNRVTNSGVTYDAAGNLTSNGTASYSYDELNRLISTGLMSYGYNGDNRRVVAYYGQSYPQFTMNLYGPSGQRLSSFTYQNNASNGSGGWGTPLTSNAVNYLYLGSKPLNYSDDTMGSNASSAQYYPYGQVLTGSTPDETQAFGTYVQDESGLLYSDQRYMYQNWGRFLTPDPSDTNINQRNPTSWSRYTYVLNDPANSSDPTGLCAATYAGICDNSWCPPSQMSCGEYTLPPQFLNPTPSIVAGTTPAVDSITNSGGGNDDSGTDQGCQAGDICDPDVGEGSGQSGGALDPDETQNLQQWCSAQATQAAQQAAQPYLNFQPPAWVISAATALANVLLRGASWANAAAGAAMGGAVKASLGASIYSSFYTSSFNTCIQENSGMMNFSPGP
jgi:RHS repeat-associated protein